MFGPVRCKNWTPLYTQQLRLRHLVRLIGYNISTDPSVSKGSYYYYTLHSAIMCSPFYTSEKINSVNPRWKEVEFTDENGHLSGLVIRIWAGGEKSDSVICVWGVYFSGLIYLGNKIQEISPLNFDSNTIVFQFIGGYFTSQKLIKYNDIEKPLPFINNVNIVNVKNKEKVCRNISINILKQDARTSYNIEKLQRLHNLQLSIRNKGLDNRDLRERICQKYPMFDETIQIEIQKKPEKLNISNLSVSTLNKFLNQQCQPTRFQRQEAWKIKKLIEVSKFNCKLLSQEKDRKTAFLRQLTQTYNKLSDNNDYASALLMDRYRELSRDVEKMREWRKKFVDIRDAYLQASVYLNLRRKQLMSELLDIYPIKKIDEKKYTICGVYLPESESLHENDDTALSVALGYVTHCVQMCSIFLNIPLRYPVHHYGSRSKIYDYTTDKIPDKEREFPLDVRGKDQRYFHYAIYLLNKNIAQLRWYCGLSTHDLRTTLYNLLTLLQFRSDYGLQNDSENILNIRNNRLKTENITKTLESLKFVGPSDNIEKKRNLSFVDQTHRPSPRSLLGIQLANSNFSEQQLNVNCNIKLKMGERESSNSLLSSHCVDCNIEQGLDLLDPRVSKLLCDSFNEHSSTEPINDESKSRLSVNKKRITRSVGSLNGDDVSSTSKFDESPSSEPLLNKSVACHSTNATLSNSLQDERNEFLQEWLSNGPALVCSEENLYPEEYLGATVSRNYPKDNIDHHLLD